MRFEVTPDDIENWAGSFRDDPSLLRALAQSAGRFDAAVAQGAGDAADVRAAAAELTPKLQTVLTTLAEAIGSLEHRAVVCADRYDAQERTVRAAIGGSRD